MSETIAAGLDLLAGILVALVVIGFLVHRADRRLRQICDALDVLNRTLGRVDDTLLDIEDQQNSVASSSQAEHGKPNT